jgi:aryl-alcohol dehydrogenase-like predicted oxidoreductase
MRYKLLGKSGLRVSELCLGTMTFMQGLNWGSPKEENRKIFDAFIEAGGNFVDTSNAYGTSEEYLGEFMSVHRERIVVGTKYTGSMAISDANSSGNHRKSLVRSIEISLKRLKADYIDLLWLNSWDFMTPVEEIMRALDDVVRQGKVLYFGISNTPAWFISRANTLAELRGWTPFIALQLWYNLLKRDIERELLPMAQALDIGVTAWTPLASGLLTGKYNKKGMDAATRKSRTEAPRRLDDSIASRFVQQNDRNLSIVEAVCKVATEVGSTPAQVALNWLRHRDVIPIFGARTVRQVKENLACLNFTLSDEQIQRMEEVSQIPPAYPHDFLASSMVRHHTFGGMFQFIDHMCPLKLRPLNYRDLRSRRWPPCAQWAGASSRVADLTRMADGASWDLCQSA